MHSAAGAPSSSRVVSGYRSVPDPDADLGPARGIGMEGPLVLGAVEQVVHRGEDVDAARLPGDHGLAQVQLPEEIVVLGGVVGEAMRTGAIGIAVGLVGALLMEQVLAAFLFGVVCFGFDDAGFKPYALIFSVDDLAE